jgi:phosphinothricin acetyltransferase
MTVTVRPAARADIPAITRIYGHSVEHGTASFELSAPDEAEMTRRFNELTTNGFPYLVAVIDGTVVGYAYAGHGRPIDSPWRTRSTSLTTVTVAASAKPCSRPSSKPAPKRDFA